MITADVTISNLLAFPEKCRTPLILSKVLLGAGGPPDVKSIAVEIVTVQPNGIVIWSNPVGTYPPDQVTAFVKFPEAQAVQTLAFDLKRRSAIKNNKNIFNLMIFYFNMNTEKRRIFNQKLRHAYLVQIYRHIKNYLL
jgi:hypothetical protein